MEVLIDILNQIELLESDSSLKSGSQPRSPEELREYAASLGRSMDSEEFFMACTHFYSMPREQAIPALISALGNIGPQAIQSSAVLLGLLDAREAINPLIGAFKFRNTPVTDELMRTLFWFGKSPVPLLYEACISSKFPKIRRDSLAAMVLISNPVPRDRVISCKLHAGKELTIAERRATLEYLSEFLLHDHRTISEIMFSEIAGGKSRKSSLLSTLRLYLPDDELVFIGKQINEELLHEPAERLPPPKALIRSEGNCPGKKVRHGAPGRPLLVLHPGGKGPTNKT